MLKIGCLWMMLSISVTAFAQDTSSDCDKEYYDRYGRWMENHLVTWWGVPPVLMRSSGKYADLICEKLSEINYEDTHFFITFLIDENGIPYCSSSSWEKRKNLKRRKCLMDNNGKTSEKITKWLLIGISVIFLAVMRLLPLITVITEALRSGWKIYVAAVTDEYTIKALLLTVKATLFAVIFNTIFGIFAAWALTKFQFKGKKLLTTLIDLPVTISPVIAGLIFLLIFGRQSPVYFFLCCPSGISSS